MKNNERFLLDIENIPDRFLDEVNESNKAVVSEVRKEKIQWTAPVSVAALIAAVIAVPFFLSNLKPSIDQDDNERPAVTEVTSVSTEGTVTSAESVTTVTETEAQTSPVTSMVTVISEVISEVTSQETNAPATMAENRQNDPAPEENRQPETQPAETEAEVIVTDDPEKKIVQSMGVNYLEYDDQAEIMMNKARSLPEQYLGTIADEQDLIDKVRNFYINEYGLEYVENMERDYCIINGERIDFERRYPKYSTIYNEDVDAWYIVIMPPDGEPSEETEVQMEDGTTQKIRKVSTTLGYTGPYLIIRASDGKILAYNKYGEENIKWSNENY